MKKIKNIDTDTATLVATHDSVFHSDEIIAIALISITVEGNIVVTRTRDEESLKMNDFLIDVGGEYNPLEGKYDHHQFKEGDPLYGLSSAGLVWIDLRDTFINIWGEEAVEELDAFIAAVDSRDTRVNYDESNTYEHIFNAITACNEIDPSSDNQYSIFMSLVHTLESLILNMLNKNLEEVTAIVESLEDQAEKANKAKEEIFKQREDSYTELDNVVVAKFFPDWRKISRNLAKPFIMPGDRPGQFKFMIDTNKTKIVCSKDEVFTHANGFISVVAPKKDSETLGTILFNGKDVEVSIDKVKKILKKIK